MKNIYKLLLVATLLFSTQCLYSQYYEKAKAKQSFADKLFFGGGLGLQFGDVTAIDVSPIVGYRITPKLHAGVGLSYSYYNYSNLGVSASNYSASVFTRFFLLDNIFAHGEVEALNAKVFTSFNPEKSYRKWIDSYLVGAGYFQRIGEKSGMYIMVLWNLNENEFTPYKNPVVRIGFAF